MMRPTIPENGYESPQSPDDGTLFGMGIHNNVERRRLRRLTADDKLIEVDNAGSAVLQNEGRPVGLHIGAEEDGENMRGVGYRDRVGCYTWTWFTMTMATGGIANVLHSIPYRTDWLRIVGIVVFLFNLLLFLINCFFLTLRFKWNPGSFRASFTSPSESLFVPACIVSVGTILINICQYGIPVTGQWLQTTMQVCFWIYLSVAVFASSGIYLIIWSTQTFPIHTMTPIWIFPAYPLLLIAPLASTLIDTLPGVAAAIRINAIAISLAAVCIQGTGFLVSLMIYSAFIYRLMTQKLPRETTRPGMFVSVGPSGFTVAGIVSLGSIVQTKIMPFGYMTTIDAGSIVKLIADLTGLWLWGLCLWFFIVSVGAHWKVMRPYDRKHHIRFDMTWYSFVFPNTAMITATQAIGRTFDCNPIKIFGTVLAAMLVILWLFVFGMMIRALCRRRLLWPGAMDESELMREQWARNGGGGADGAGTKKDYSLPFEKQ